MGLQGHLRIRWAFHTHPFLMPEVPSSPQLPVFVISCGPVLSKESQHTSFNYRRNTYAVMTKPNPWWFNYGLNTHLFTMSTSGWYCCVKSTQDNVCIYSSASICSQIGTSWWQIRCVSSLVFKFTSFTNTLYQLEKYVIIFLAPEGLLLFMKWMFSLGFQLSYWSVNGIPFPCSVS